MTIGALLYHSTKFFAVSTRCGWRRQTCVYCGCVSASSTRVFVLPPSVSYRECGLNTAWALRGCKADRVSWDVRSGSPQCDPGSLTAVGSESLTRLQIADLSCSIALHRSAYTGRCNFSGGVSLYPGALASLTKLGRSFALHDSPQPSGETLTLHDRSPVSPGEFC